MKNIFITLSIFLSTCAFAQVAIGKASVNPSVSLEFYDNADNVRGIILPWVDGVSDTAPFITNSPATETVVNGTLVYEKSKKKVKVMDEGVKKKKKKKRKKKKNRVRYKT